MWRQGAIFVVFQSIKPLQIILLVYDTLGIDMSVIDLPDLQLDFIGAATLAGGYMIAFGQGNHYPSFEGTCGELTGKPDKPTSACINP